jgi:hypothetical protein
MDFEGVLSHLNYLFATDEFRMMKDNIRRLDYLDRCERLGLTRSDILNIERGLDFNTDKLLEALKLLEFKGDQYEKTLHAMSDYSRYRIIRWIGAVIKYEQDQLTLNNKRDHGKRNMSIELLRKDLDVGVYDLNDKIRRKYSGLPILLLQWLKYYRSFSEFNTSGVFSEEKMSGIRVIYMYYMGDGSKAFNKKRTKWKKIFNANYYGILKQLRIYYTYEGSVSGCYKYLCYLVDMIEGMMLKPMMKGAHKKITCEEYCEYRD